MRAKSSPLCVILNCCELHIAGCGGSSLEWITPEGEQIDLCADAVRLEAEGIWDPVKREWKV